MKSVGEDHPMVAIALDKVATFYAEQKKYDQAKGGDGTGECDPRAISGNGAVGGGDRTDGGGE